MLLRCFCRRYADCACDDAAAASSAAADFWVSNANCSAALIGSGCAAGCAAFCCDAGFCCAWAPLLSSEYGFDSKSISGRSFPACDGKGIWPAAASSLAPTELALDSNVLSLGSGAFLSSVSMNWEFLDVDAGDKSMSVSSTGFSGAGRLGEKNPLNAASKKA